MKYLLIFICASILYVSAEKKSFDGYKLFKVIPKSEVEVNVLEDLRDNGVGDFWTEYFRVQDDIKIMVSPTKTTGFLNQLKTAGIRAEIIIEDVQQVINNQLNPSNNNDRSSNSFHSMTWDDYYNLEAINTWLDELVATYPNIVSKVVMGRSVENREIRGIKIDYKPEKTEKKIAVIEGTLHAREWITTTTVTWMIKEFLTSEDAAVRAMAEDLEWHIFPVVNPDGYAYTFTTNRLWRKNRSRANFISCNATDVDDDMSNGVDLNRNFDFFWMSTGASNDSCTNTFAGPSPASEPETQAIQEYVTGLKNTGDIVYYLSFHSYSQLFIYPYSHVSSVQDMAPYNYADMYEIANRSATKLSEKYGTTYRVGISADVLYPMSGSSFDWVKYNANASVSYLIELRDRGEFGFILPKEQIIPNCLEIMDAMIEMDKTTRDLGYYTGSSVAVLSSTFFVILSIGFALVLK